MPTEQGIYKFKMKNKFFVIRSVSIIIIINNIVFDALRTPRRLKIIELLLFFVEGKQLTETIKKRFF